MDHFHQFKRMNKIPVINYFNKFCAAKFKICFIRVLTFYCLGISVPSIHFRVHLVTLNVPLSVE